MWESPQPPLEAHVLVDHLCLTERGTPVRSILPQWYLGSDHLEAPIPVTAHRGKASCSPSLISRDSSPTLTSMVRPRPSVCTATLRLSSLTALSSCVLRNRRGNETSFSLSFGFGLKQSTPSWISAPM